MLAKRKLREWMVRYLPAEIAGTVTALGGFWAVYVATDSLPAAAIAGTISENFGYYGVVVCREIWNHWRVQQQDSNARRLRLSIWYTVRNMLVEFGPAEALDSLLVRPSLFYILPLLFADHMAAAVLTAKLLADLIFYIVAVIGYEFHKKLPVSQP